MEPKNWQARRSGAEPVRPGDRRTPWQRDRARILHSAAFRRLQSKTQIMNVGENDFYRTRLTHSLEAAQIGSSLINHLRLNMCADSAAILPDENLMEALCLAHDIGHPPFGHGGETALNYKMLSSGGFEGNGQTFRIVGKLESYHPEHGMDLCRRTLLGLLKYPVLMPSLPAPEAEMPSSLAPWKPAKAVFASESALLDWVLEPLNDADKHQFQQVDILPDSPWQRSKFKSLDASIMELADDIAYGVHDLEDAVVTGTLTEALWNADIEQHLSGLSRSLRSFVETLSMQLFSSHHHTRKNAIGALVNLFVSSVEMTTVLPDADCELIRLNATLPEEERALLIALKAIVFKHVIHQSSIQQLRYRSQSMLMQIFDAFYAEPMRLLPKNTRERWEAAFKQEGQSGADRILCDYISGMTDDYAERMYHRLFA